MALKAAIDENQPEGAFGRVTAFLGADGARGVGYSAKTSYDVASAMHGADLSEFEKQRTLMDPSNLARETSSVFSEINASISGPPGAGRVTEQTSFELGAQFPRTRWKRIAPSTAFTVSCRRRRSSWKDA